MSQARKNRSHRKNRSPQNNKAPLRYGVIIAVIVILFGGAALLLTPPQEPYVPEVLGAPNVDVAQEVIDFGDVPVNQYVQAEFRVRNTGDQTLEILDREPPLQVVEGCCPPRTVLSSTRVQPGDEAILKVQFTMHPGMDGPHDFRIALRTNDPQEPLKELQILSNWVS